MSRHPVSVGGRADAAEFRQELLGRLGVRPDASDQDIEAAHNGLVEFLELAPHEVKPWAATQAADVDEAFALLSGPEQDLVPLAAMAQEGLGQTPPAPSPAPAAPAPRSAPAAPAPSTGKKLMKPKMLWAAVPVLVVAIVFAVFQMGKGSDVPGINGTPTGTETTAAASGAPAAVPVDQAKVAALMKKISANPKDIASLQSLGDLYFAAADYKNAAAWEEKVLVVDPKNQVSLLAAGATQFNLGNAAVAKKHWLVAAGLYPKNQEVHYDLGFMYMSQTPPDSANMQAEWKKVVQIDPTSNLAKSVQTHITGTKPTAAPTK
jgi:tetratricopeptide (TPR) repeat protein